MIVVTLIWKTIFICEEEREVKREADFLWGFNGDITRFHWTDSI